MATPIQPVTAGDAVAVTPSDTTIYGAAAGGGFDALWVGVAGNVAVRTIAGTTTTFVGAVAGQIIPIQCDKVMSTNTTASSIVGMRY